MVSFWYNAGSGWTELTQFSPNFSTTPYIGIVGQDKYGHSINFDVSNVTINDTVPFPLPPSIWLLGSGVIGLAG